MTFFRITPKLEHDVMYRYAMGKPCSQERPRTFNEKSLELKLYEFPEVPLAYEGMSKYRVRKNVTRKGHDEPPVNLYGYSTRVMPIELEEWNLGLGEILEF